MDPFYDLLYGFVAALGIGILVGIERERDQSRKEDIRVAGVRTFTLIALLGATSGLLYQYNTLLSTMVLQESSYWLQPDTIFPASKHRFWVRQQR